MIRDVTDDVREHLAKLAEAIDALKTLNKYFKSRETNAAALGELSEVLIAGYVGGERRSPGAKGHDIVKGDQLIEVKSRLVGRWKDGLMFDFSKHSDKAHIAYCLAWDMGEERQPLLQHVFEVEVPFLTATWGTPDQDKYSARTTLRKLKAALSRRPGQ
jgi:hypothetical protein